MKISTIMQTKNPQMPIKPIDSPKANLINIESIQNRLLQLKKLLANPNLGDDSKKETESEIATLEETIKKIKPKKIPNADGDNLSLNHNFKNHKDYAKWHSIFQDEEFIEFMDLLELIAIKDVFKATKIICDAYDLGIIYRFGESPIEISQTRIEYLEWQTTEEYKAMNKIHELNFSDKATGGMRLINDYNPEIEEVDYA